MNLSRDEREELQNLSLEVFGTKSKFQKFFETKELITRKKVEMVKAEDGTESEKETQEPVLFNGVKQYRMKYRSTEEVLELLRDFKAKREAFLAEMQKQQDEAKARKEEADKLKKIQDDLTGSAL